MLVLEVGLVKGPKWGINIEVAVKGGGKVEVTEVGGHVVKFLWGRGVCMEVVYVQGTSTNIIGLVVVGVGITRGKEEIVSTKGMQERREGTAIVVEVGIRAGIGIGAGERVMEWLNSMAMIAMVEVLARGRCWGKG